MNDFIGVKIALLHDGEVLVTHRDDKPSINFPGMWEFPGGEREPGETPFECVSREVYEEIGLTLTPGRILWEKKYPAMHDPALSAYFMVAKISDEDIKAIRFGDEGQGWKMLRLDDFMADPKVIEQLKGRLQDYLKSLQNAGNRTDYNQNNNTAT